MHNLYTEVGKVDWAKEEKASSRVCGRMEDRYSWGHDIYLWDALNLSKQNNRSMEYVITNFCSRVCQWGSGKVDQIVCFGCEQVDGLPRKIAYKIDHRSKHSLGRPCTIALVMLHIS